MGGFICSVVGKLAARTNRDAVRDDRGTSLIEVVVAMVLLAILGTAVLAVVLQSQAATVTNRSRVAASNLAAREIDLVREQFEKTKDGPLDLFALGTVVNPHPLDVAAAEPFAIDGAAYTVTRSVAWNVVGNGASACSGGALVNFPSLSVTVAVTWPHMSSVKPVTTSATMTPRKGVGIPTTSSFMAVKVVNARGLPNPGRTVKVFSASENKVGLTDSSGCAVIQINPAAGATGTSYSVRLSDAGYVDVSGTPEPTIVAGMVRQGELNSAIDMAYDRAATLTIQVTGAGVTDEAVAGQTVSLYQSQFAGSTAISQRTLTTATTVVTGLWPSRYGAFFGATQPPSLPMIDLESGGSGVINVELEMAGFSLAGFPAGGDLIAVPAGVGASCTSAGSRVVAAASAAVIPGIWTFFVRGDAFGCSPGPQDVPLDPGANPAVTWAPTTLTLTAAPVGQGAFWAVSNAVATASCQIPVPASRAVKIAEATGPVGPISLPAGNWYIFAMPEGPGGPAGACNSTGLVAVPYGIASTFKWKTVLP